MPIIQGRLVPYNCEYRGTTRAGESYRCRRVANGQAGGRRFCQEHLEQFLATVVAEVEEPTPRWVEDMQARIYGRDALPVVLPPPPSLQVLPAPAPLATCMACQSRRYTLSEGEGGLVFAARCRACDLPCARCRGTGLIEVMRGLYAYQDPCPCERDLTRRRIDAVNGARLPAAYVGLLYGKLPLVPPSDSQKRAHEAAFRFAKEYAPKRTKRGLFFFGPPGTGKTLALCRALALIAKEKPRAVRYVHLPNYLGTMKDSWGDDSIEVSAVTALVQVDVLLVDEICLRDRRGVPRDLTKWEQKQLDRIAHERWNAGRPTLWATNCSPAQIEAQTSESTWSRIRSTVEFLEVRGADLRQTSRRRDGRTP